MCPWVVKWTTGSTVGSAPFGSNEPGPPTPPPNQKERREKKEASGSPGVGRWGPRGQRMKKKRLGKAPPMSIKRLNKKR